MLDKGYKVLRQDFTLKDSLITATMTKIPLFFKCFPHDINPYYTEVILNDTSKFICLERRNKLNQILSNEIANMRQEWEYPPKNTVTYIINIDNLFEKVETINRYFSMKNKFDNILTTLYYEDYEIDPANILRLLEIRDYKPEYLMSLPKKLFPDYSKVIENYDEVLDWWINKGKKYLKISTLEV